MNLPEEYKLTPIIVEEDESSPSFMTASQYEVKKAAETILTDKNRIEDNFYKTIDSNIEFGISRTISDKLYHLPKLLSNPELIWQEGTTSYIIKSSTPDSAGHTITLEHRLQASSHEEAEKIATIVAERLRGVLHKIHMAAWKLANELRQFTFTCQMTELMRLCYPNREARFQNQEKIEFYEHLRALENTKMIYSRKKPTAKEGKQTIESIEIRLIEIHNKIGEKEEYPQAITLSVFNAPALQNEKLAFVGARFKNTTLKLHAEVISVAAWLQARKAQHNDNNKSISVDEDYLIRVAGLEKTAQKNKSMARKRLHEKLLRCVEQGIIEAPIEKQGANLIIRYGANKA